MVSRVAAEETEFDAAILVGVNAMRDMGLAVPDEAAQFVTEWPRL